MNKYLFKHIVVLILLLIIGFGGMMISSYGNDVKRVHKPWRIKYTHFSNILPFYPDSSTISCDSLLLYPYSDSYEAFGHVIVDKSETHKIYCDYLFYDKNNSLIQMRYNVIINSGDIVCYSDSVDIDIIYNFIYFFEGGMVKSPYFKIVSDWGEYHYNENKAILNYDVIFKNSNDNIKIRSDTMVIDCVNREAIFRGPSIIYNNDKTDSVHSVKLNLVNNIIIK
jgi:lipopolysaccharide export system protein LptA